MAGQPWAKVWVADLQTDAGYKRLRAEGKAVWWQSFCEMHTEDTDRISGTIPDLALALALPESQVAEGIDQIELHGVCEVQRDSHGVVTLMSRRRHAELSGRESGRIRKENERIRKKHRAANAECDSSSQTCHTPVHDTHTRVRADSDSYSGTVVKTERQEEDARDGFETVWALYAHKVNRKHAERAWGALTKANRAKAINAIPAYVARTDPNGAGGLTIRAHFATWLRAERWNDESPTAIAHTNGHAKRVCTACGSGLGLDGTAYMGRPYCGPCYDRAAWTLTP